MSVLDLAATQRWVREVVTNVDGVDACDGFTPDDVVRGNNRLSASQRLEIYQRGYFHRLINCLGELLPVLRHALGGELFEMFAVDYLEQRPSASYSLSELDAGFVDYLDANRPDRDAPETEREDWPDFIVDLATLERDIRRVYDGPGVEHEATLTATDVEALDSADLDHVSIELVPCCIVRRFRFPVRDYLLAVRRGVDPPLPLPRETHAALTRRDYTVRLLELSAAEHDALVTFASGQPVAAVDTSTLLALTNAGLCRALRPVAHDSSATHPSPPSARSEPSKEDLT